MWKCINCGFTASQKPIKPPLCRNCGLIQAGVGTEEKYKILEDYCHPLSLIMRNRNLDHYFIDACAGSGKVQAFGRDEYLDGSPLIMAKTRYWVEKKIKDKSKPKHVKCIFIEVNPKTYELLKRWTRRFPDCKLISGDCNQVLPQVLDNIESEIWKPFAFIYIDPFGLGDPPIKMETLRRILEREYTELFLQLNIDALIRVAGWLRHLDDPDKRLRQQAESFYEILKVFIGSERIEDFRDKWSKWRKGERESKTLEYYISGLSSYYPFNEHIGIPVGSKRPVYYLIYTTRNETGRKIMRSVMMKARRRGAESLERWLR